MNFFKLLLWEFLPFLPLWVGLYIAFRRILKAQSRAARAFDQLALSHNVEFYKLCRYTKTTLLEKAKITELLPEEKEYFHHCHAFIDYFEKNFREVKNVEPQPVEQ